MIWGFRVPQVIEPPTEALRLESFNYLQPWLEPQDEEKLAEYLERIGIQHISAKELTRRRRDPGVLEVPKAAWWPRIVPACLAFEEIREAVGAPLPVANGYRSKAYNARVGGAKNSQHIQFRALDIDPPSADDVDDVRAAIQTMQEVACDIYREQGKRLACGLGIYSNGRIHIDFGFRQRCWGRAPEVLESYR